jgi:signal peptidase I
MTLSYTTITVIAIISVIGFFVGLWGVFQKAGYKGWQALIPFYNFWIWLKIISRPRWWMIFLCFPFITIFMVYMMIWKTIRLFRKTNYVPLLFGTFFSFIYLPYLGFSAKEKYCTLADLPVFKKSTFREWGDALIFAVAAAFIFRTFLFEFYKIPTSSMESSLMVGDFLAVDKIAYGGRVPQTVLAIPFVHHTIPGTKSAKSYMEWIQFPYLRFRPINDVQRNDVVVFNYPAGDTVAIERQSESYYAIVREFEAILDQNAPDYARKKVHNGRYSSEYITHIRMNNQGKYYQGKGREAVKKEYQVVSRPIDKRENYVKRCVALPGDVFTIINGQTYIDGQLSPLPQRVQFSYFVTGELSPAKRKSLNINEEDRYRIDERTMLYNINNHQKEQIEKMGYELHSYIEEPGEFDYSVFPHDPRYKWNKDNFGPVTIPAKGVTVTLNDSTIVLYTPIIVNYEHNDLKIKDDKIYINGEETTSYTFKQDYFFMMGDNRHNSLDSRFWGFVPRDHIVGKASFVWLSLDKFKNGGEGKIRWNRMFKKIK